MQMLLKSVPGLAFCIFQNMFNSYIDVYCAVIFSGGKGVGGSLMKASFLGQWETIYLFIQNEYFFL